MACCPTNEKYGYEDSRFEKDIDEHFHCSICFNVLKDPRTCKNEHAFCLDCISEHLRVNSETCPECKEDLTVATLRRPRLLNNYLSKLKINCNHASRGCVEYICVEDLESHAGSCGFAPVMCSNENCGMVINKQEREHHETVVCKYRKEECLDSGKLQEAVERLEGRLMELEGKVDTNHVEMKRIVGKMEGSLGRMNKKINEKVETLNEMVNVKVEALQNQVHQEVEGVKKQVGEVKKEVGGVKKEVGEVKKEVGGVKKEVGEVKKEVGGVKKEVGEVKKEVGGVKKEVGEVKKEVGGVKKEVGGVQRDVKDLKENLSTVNKDMNDVKVMMSQILEKLNVLELMNKLPSSLEGMLNTRKEDILIAGNISWSGTAKSAEIFLWEKNGWFEISSMNEEHQLASSFIYGDQMFVVGGFKSKTIETLNLNELPLKWKKCATDLPYPCSDHQTVVHQQRVIHIGGCHDNIGRNSDVISELQLTPPSIMKELCRMPESQDYHGAEIVDDKVLIFGGQTNDGNILNSVLVFDLKKNECKRMPPLPYPLSSMATVHWRDQAVLLGGEDKDSKILNDVFMYDCKTGKITVLPSMLEKRCACCAVITGNTIVVMGGVNEEYEVLNSVECFTMGGSSWKHLPVMNIARFYAVAEILPSTRKYV